ncbi:MAG: ribulose bisphosphate carboxylase small subunit [Actinomycetota bacterium]|nr:ribulose bisphosphate carboxylase small subunit [Actinomycetota bacterium]
MRITQGTFSFLPDFTDEEIEAQIRYSLANGWAIAVEYTDDPHPRNSYWELWSHPLFDLEEGETDEPMRLMRECRTANPNHYVKVLAYDASYGRQTTALSFIVNRPPDEPGFRLDRTDFSDRHMLYSLRPYATQGDSLGRRYGNKPSTNGASADGPAKTKKGEKGKQDGAGS